MGLAPWHPQGSGVEPSAYELLVAHRPLAERQQLQPLLPPHHLKLCERLGQAAARAERRLRAEGHLNRPLADAQALKRLAPFGGVRLRVRHKKPLDDGACSARGSKTWSADRVGARQTTRGQGPAYSLVLVP